MNHNTLRLLATATLVVCVALVSLTLHAEEQKKGFTITEALMQIKKNVVFIGEPSRNYPLPPRGILTGAIDPKRIQFRATGFLVSVQGIIHLITAKHVVQHYIREEIKDGKRIEKFVDDDMFIFFNRADGKVGYRSIGYVKKTESVKWMFGDDPEVDLAMIPFAVEKGDDIMYMPERLFLDSSKLQELYDVFFVAYQPGSESPLKIAPVMRTGMISRVNDDKTFYIDGFTFPGNSGSPVFYKYSAVRFGEGGFNIGHDELGGKFIGIVGGYIPYQEVAVSEQTKRARIVFEENTGLARVWSVDFLKVIEESPAFKQQVIDLKSKTR